MDIITLRKRLYKLSAICFVIAVVVFIINYFVFHYVTDDGITLIWHPEAGKPFVTNLIGILGADMVFASIVSALCAKIICKK
jgi:Sec-independent protein secretion pathway component TatC